MEKITILGTPDCRECYLVACQHPKFSHEVIFSVELQQYSLFIYNQYQQISQIYLPAQRLQICGYELFLIGELMGNMNVLYCIQDLMIYQVNNKIGAIMIEYQADKERRQLGQNEDLQLAIDRDNQFEDKDLKTKILFAVQNIGKNQTFIRNGKQIQAYLKKQHCEQSIKDLVKYIRKDVPQNPKVSIILSNYNIMQSDLIKILVLHAEDKKLSFWLLALMQYLTAKPHENLLLSQKQKLNNALREYKKTFINNQGITYLIFHISDYVKTPKQKRQKAHMQLMEFIIHLIRNLLQIRTDELDSDELHSHFLIAMIKEDMLGPLFYLLQNQKGQLNGRHFQKSQLMQRIEIPLLEIFYHIFTCFDPTSIYQTRGKINIRQQAMRMSSKVHQPVRHSRFMPNFQQLSKSGINRVVHNLDKRQQLDIGQRKAPVRRVQLKKVRRIQRQYIQQNFLQMMIDPSGDGNKKMIRELVYEYAKQFVQVQFQILNKLIFDSIYKQIGKVNKENIMQYLILCGWVLKMTRSKYQKARMMAKTPQEKANVEFDFTQVHTIMQITHFELIYKLLFREATREKKKQFDVNMFNAALTLFLSYIQVIQDISISFNMSDRKNANTLMANMFRHDIARIFKIGFHQIIHERILSKLIISCYKFFKLLSQYSGGKVLTIQTNKMLKGKKKTSKREEQDQRQMQNFISQDSDDENQSQSYRDDEGGQKKMKQKKQKKQRKEEKNQQQQLKFQQRKFNQMTQFAIVADYQIISKYLIFLKEEQFQQNTKELNTAIFYYIERIVRLLKGQWLFFQAETLIIFSQILNSQKFARQYQKQRQVIKHICSCFIQLLKKNKLAIVQSLFRYSNLQTKQQIMKDYNEISEEVEVIDHQFH